MLLPPARPEHVKVCWDQAICFISGCGSPELDSLFKSFIIPVPAAIVTCVLFAFVSAPPLVIPDGIFSVTSSIDSSLSSYLKCNTFVASFAFINIALSFVVVLAEEKVSTLSTVILSADASAVTVKLLATFKLLLIVTSFGRPIV